VEALIDECPDNSNIVEACTFLLLMAQVLFSFKKILVVGIIVFLFLFGN